MIILAIGMGLNLALQFLLDEIAEYRKQRRKAAKTIQNQFWRNMFRRRWRRRPDPTSIMGSTTAWDMTPGRRGYYDVPQTFILNEWGTGLA
jgi:predicted AlkP superfamily pyrophosphatase or phosphodiesterase